MADFVGNQQHIYDLIGCLRDNPDARRFIDKASTNAINEGDSGLLSRVFDKLPNLPSPLSDILAYYPHLIVKLQNALPRYLFANQDLAPEKVKQYTSQAYFPVLESWVYKLVFKLRPYLFEAQGNTLKPEIEAAIGKTELQSVIKLYTLQKLKDKLEELEASIEPDTYNKLREANSLEAFEETYNNLSETIKANINLSECQEKAKSQAYAQLLKGYVARAIFLKIKELKEQYGNENSADADINKDYLAWSSVMSQVISEAVIYENIKRYPEKLEYLQNPNVKYLVGLSQSLNEAIDYLHEQKKKVSPNKQHFFSKTKKELIKLREETDVQIEEHVKKMKPVTPEVITNVLGKFEKTITTALKYKDINKHESRFKQKVNEVVETLINIVLAPFLPKPKRQITDGNQENKSTKSPSINAAIRIGVFTTRTRERFLTVKNIVSVAQSIYKRLNDQLSSTESENKPLASFAVK